MGQILIDAYTVQSTAYSRCLGPLCGQALITNTTCDTLADGTCVIMANNVDCP